MADQVVGNDPYEFLTADEMAIMKEHYHLVKDCRSQEETEKALRGWSDRQRRVVIRMYEKIRTNGWAISGLYPSGSLKFAKIKVSQIEQVMALSDNEFSLYLQGSLRFVGNELRQVER